VYLITTLSIMILASLPPFPVILPLQTVHS